MGTQRRNRQAVLDADRLLIEKLSRLQETVAAFVYAGDTWQAFQRLDDVNDAWISFGEALDSVFQYIASRVIRDEDRRESQTA